MTENPIPPLRMSIRSKGNGFHDLSINGTEFGWNLPKGGFTIDGFDRDRGVGVGVTRVTVTFLVDELHVSNSMTDEKGGSDV